MIEHLYCIAPTDNLPDMYIDITGGMVFKSRHDAELQHQQMNDASRYAILELQFYTACVYPLDDTYGAYRIVTRWEYRRVT